ncbi:TAXI family TRAP transporter solute-binding subunit [Thermodesulfobacteriota bacterium]
MKYKTLITALAVTALLTTTAAAKTINLGSSNPGSLTHSTSTAVAKLLTQELKIQARVQPHGGQSAFVPAVAAGEVDFGIANAFELVDAMAGTGIYKGQDLKGLRAVAVLMPLRTAWWVAKDSPIKSFKDLKGKKLPGGWTQQKIIQYLSLAWLAHAGLTYDDVKMVPVPNVNRGAEDFIQGKVDTFFFAVGSGKVREAGAKKGGVRALPLDTSPEAVARFRKHVPVMFPMLLKPSKANYGILEPTYISAMDFVLLTNKNVPADLIYKVTKTVHGGKKAFFQSFKPFGANFSPTGMAMELPAGNYHPGAIKFYKEIGQWPPQKHKAGK